MPLLEVPATQWSPLLMAVASFAFRWARTENPAEDPCIVLNTLEVRRTVGLERRSDRRPNMIEAPTEALLFQPDVTACVLGHVIPVSSSSPVQFVHDHVGQSTILMMIIKNKSCGTIERLRRSVSRRNSTDEPVGEVGNWIASVDCAPRVESCRRKTRRTASEVVAAPCGRPSTSWRRKERQGRPAGCPIRSRDGPESSFDRAVRRLENSHAGHTLLRAEPNPQVAGRIRAPH